MSYLLLKSLHIVSMVAWFAGLFYLVRLFVYHTEAFEKSEPDRSVLTHQYHIMSDRLYRIICNPAMMLTWIFGLAMIIHNGWEWYINNIWLHWKIGLVILLTIYHVYCKTVIKKLQKGEQVMSSFGFRLFNEVPTLFLLAIVLLAVYKNLLNFGYTFTGIIAFSILLFLFARVYKSKRTKTKTENDE